MADYPSLSPMSSKPDNEGYLGKPGDYPYLSPMSKPNSEEALGKQAAYPSLSPMSKPYSEEALGKQAAYPSLSPMSKPNSEEALGKQAAYPSLSPTSKPNSEEDLGKQADNPSLSPTKPNNEEALEKERVREIISGLPKTKGWVTQYLYQYQGFWYWPPYVEGIISAQQNFLSEEGDILVATSLKCGTTWLKALAFAIKNRETYQSSSSAETPPHPLFTNNPHALVPSIEYPPYQKHAVEILHAPRLLSTHMPYTSLPESVISLGCRIVYMCRDPKDVFVSMYKFYDKVVGKNIPPIPFPEAFDSFRHGVSLTGPYWDHVLGYYKASLERPDKVLFLKYEDMQSDTFNLVKRMAEFIGYPISVEEEGKGVIQEIIKLCSFENMSNLEVTTKGKLFGHIKNDIWYRKGKAGDSKNYLTAGMMDHLDQITKEKFPSEIGY